MKKNSKNEDYWWNRLQEEIINTDLYSRSGTEAGISNNTIKLKEKSGDYFPTKVSGKNVPRMVFDTNPDRYVDYPKLNRFIFGKYPKNWLIGNYQKIYIGHHNDEKIRRGGSSGGIVSGIQIYSLQKKIAEYAITLQMRKDKPYLTEPIITKDPEIVMDCAQSKYTISPVNQILSSINQKHRSIIYTGLPHEIVAIRKLQMLEHKLVKPIQLVLGIFYGETLAFSAINSILRSHKIDNVNEITRLRFREGEWPGNLKINLKDGKEISIRKLHANYLIPSHITNYSLYQIDFTSELADISVGDAWAPTYEQRGGGWSVVIVRSQKGQEIISKMVKDKVISLKEITLNKFIEMHSHGLDLKKRGAFLRIELARKKNLPVPEYGYEPINIPFKRRVFERLLYVLFSIFKSSILIKILEKVPVEFTGKFFIILRNLWKKTTKSTKRGGLKSLKFQLTNRLFDNKFVIKDVRDFWDRVSEIYEPTNKKVGYVHFQRFEKAVECGDFKPRQKILNIWSRTGRLIPYLRKFKNVNITNLEASPKMIEIAKRNFPNETFELTDLEKLSNIKSNYFDRIISLETLEHTPKPLKFVAELHRVLKEDGLLVMSLPPEGFEVPTIIYTSLFDNHGEGPHRFINPPEVKRILSYTGFMLLRHSVHFILPLGNEKLTRLSEVILGRILKGTFLENFAVRHFYVAKKPKQYIHKPYA